MSAEHKHPFAQKLRKPLEVFRHTADVVSGAERRRRREQTESKEIYGAALTRFLHDPTRITRTSITSIHEELRVRETTIDDRRYRVTISTQVSTGTPVPQDPDTLTIIVENPGMSIHVINKTAEGGYTIEESSPSYAPYTPARRSRESKRGRQWLKDVLDKLPPLEAEPAA